MDMNQKETHQAEQELALFNQLMFNKEVLTQKEYEFCKAWDAEEAKNLAHIVWNNTYLNLNLYSEVDKEESDLRKEIGF
jgi:hypothetical protein